MQKIHYAEKPSVVTKATIKRFELEHAVILPESYKAFLLNNNGGRPKENIAKTKIEEFSIHYFYGFGMDYETQELTYAFKTYVDQKRIPTEFIPIAADPGSNNFCLGISGKYINRVYFWDHEFETEEGQEPGMQNMALLADSFQQFIDSLVADDVDGKPFLINNIVDAIYALDFKAIQSYLDKKVDLNKKYRRTDTGYSVAPIIAARDNLQLQQILTTAGAILTDDNIAYQLLLDLNFLSDDDDNRLALLDFWLDKGIDPSISSQSSRTGYGSAYDGMTALHHIAASGNKKLFRWNRLVEQLVKRGANINAQDSSLRTPLHYARISGNTPLCEELIKLGADKSIVDKTGEKAWND